MRRRWPAALRADFQRYYGLNLDDLGKTFRVGHAADLAANLPPDSAVARAANPDHVWGLTEQLLALNVDTLRNLVWMQSEDGHKRRNRPKPIPRPGVEDKSRMRAKDVHSLPVDEVKRLLALPRRTVTAS